MQIKLETCLRHGSNFANNASNMLDDVRKHVNRHGSNFANHARQMLTTCY